MRIESIIWRLFLCHMLAACCTSAFGQVDNKVHIIFEVKSPVLDDSVDVYITGNTPDLGMWNPSRIKMVNAGNGLWKKSIDIPAGITIEYKFTLGSWDTEAVNKDGMAYNNFSVSPTSDTSIVHLVPGWRGGMGSSKKSIVTGTVKYHHKFEGEGVAPRDIVIWLPPNFDEKKKYPVLYMHDGQNIVDPTASAFGVDWRIDESLDSMIRRKIVEPIIVVGIYNTADRSAEYTPGEKSDAYMKFVVNRLKPFIDYEYPVKRGRESTFVGGSSAGGLISFMLAWEHPEIFGGAICMSPAFKIMEIDYVKEVLTSQGKRNVFFYIDNGGVELEMRLQPGVDAMLDALKKKRYRKDKDFVYVSDPFAKHNEAAWGKRFPAAIKLVLNHRPSK